jgi:hypothetical protein
MHAGGIYPEGATQLRYAAAIAVAEPADASFLCMTVQGGYCLENGC